MNNIQFHKGVIDAPGCISNGLNLIKPNYWMYFGICVVATVSMLVVSCIPCINILLVGLVNAPLTAGIYYVLLRDMRGEPVDFGMMFKGFEKVVPIMVVGFLQAIPAIIWQIFSFAFDLGDVLLKVIQSKRGGNFYQSDEAGIAIAGGMIALYFGAAIVFFIISVAWGITFAFALPIVLENDVSPIEAIKLSARAGWSNVGGLILLFIFQFLIALLGVMMLCFGIFFVLPIIYAGWAFAYRQVFPALLPAYPNAPPPPDAYGGNFGRGQ